MLTALGKDLDGNKSTPPTFINHDGVWGEHNLRKQELCFKTVIIYSERNEKKCRSQQRPSPVWVRSQSQVTCSPVLPQPLDRRWADEPQLHDVFFHTSLDVSNQPLLWNLQYCVHKDPSFTASMRAQVRGLSKYRTQVTVSLHKRTVIIQREPRRGQKEA